MTVKTLPWIKYSGDVDKQIAAGIAREQARGARTQARVVNGTPTYRDDSGDTYVVGYGGERNYQAPAPARDFTPSEPQLRFLNGLLVEREHFYTEAEIAEGRADWRKIRPMLDALKAAPRRSYQAPVQVQTPEPAPVRARLDFSSIPDGNYALPGEGGEIKFYRVSTNGQWKNVQIRASDSLFPVKGRQGIAILHKLVEFGLTKSQMLFATKLEKCWMCGRSLTHEVSRARGTGDECASK